jgi:hypothetical protein
MALTQRFQADLLRAINGFTQGVKANATAASIRRDAADYVPPVEAWLKSIPPLRKRLTDARSSRSRIC